MIGNEMFIGETVGFFAFVRAIVPILVTVASFLLLLQLANISNLRKQESVWDVFSTTAKKAGLSDKLDRLIYEAGLDEILDASRIYQIMLLLFVLFSLPGFLAGTFVTVIFSLLLAIVLPIGIIKLMRNNRQKRVEDQLISFFNELATRMKAGSDPQTAFIESIQLTDRPLKDILIRTEKNIRQLKHFSEALIKSKEQIASVYYKDFVNAVQISTLTGGRLEDIVSGVISQINEKKTAIQRLKANMAAINMQMIFIFLSPPGLAWIMTAQNPQTGEILFGSLIGVILLIVTFIIYVIAIGFAMWIKSKVMKKIG